MANQLTRIEETLDKVRVIEEKKPSIIEKSKIESSYIKPVIEISEKFQSKDKNKEIVEALTNKLEKLRLISGKQILPITQTDDVSDCETEFSDISQFKNELLAMESDLNKISFGRNNTTTSTAPIRHYYPRPTPQDMLFEEEAAFNQIASFSSKTIYEWYIDGMSEYQILTQLYRMTMYGTACKASGSSDKSVAEFMIAGFSGQLRGWWDNVLTDSQRNEIKNSVKIVNINVVIKNEQGQDITQVQPKTEENAVYSLLTAIVQHFIGPHPNILDRSKDLLINLKCPTLTHFRWYKDVFLSKVMTREDANADFWKEKFIAGLPTLFAQKVKDRISKKHGGISIPYKDYTYGSLISECIAEGLSLCNDIKLKAQLKAQNLTGRKEIGEFCDQFAYDLSIPYSRTKKNTDSSNRTRKHHKRRKKKTSPSQPSTSRAPPRRTGSKRPNMNQIICRKCGKAGHYANNCWTKKRLNEISDEGLKRQLMAVLLNPSDDENISANSANEEINEIASHISESSTHNSESDSDCQCKAQTDYYKAILETNGLSINVLTKEEQSILDLIDQVEDNNVKRKLIEQYLATFKTEKSSILPSSEPYSLHNILESFYKTPEKEATVSDLKSEINILKTEMKDIKLRLIILENSQKDNNSSSKEITIQDNNNFLNLIDRISIQKWYINVTIVIDKDFILKDIALLDTGADMSCIREGLVPAKYFEKTSESMTSARGNKLKINYKLSNAYVCNDGMCIRTTFILVKNLSQRIILGTPFLKLIEPFTKEEDGVATYFDNRKILFKFITKPRTKEVNEIKEKLIFKEKQLEFLNEDLKIMNIKLQVNSPKVKISIKNLQEQIIREVCSDIPTAFWDRKKHIVPLPYEEDFDEKNISTKARPAQMNSVLLEHCKTEISSLIEKRLIRKSYSPWSCTAFYVNKASEIERGAPRLVINYKPLNKVLKWIRYPLPNKRDLLACLQAATIFSKFDLKSGYWQIQIAENDRYKTAFTVPFGHYEWNVMPFGLKNAPSEFQNIMNDIFTPYSAFSIVYIDDILIFSNNIDQHIKHIQIFIKIIKNAGLVVSAKKMSIFQTKIRFLGHEITKGSIIPINRAIEFADKFPDELKVKTQLQRFLGSLNYIRDYYKNLATDCIPLYERLRKNPQPWSNRQTDAVKIIKS
ncbi:hypothetical protein LguiB_009485 [Lonicera macranthoides]